MRVLPHPRAPALSDPAPHAADPARPSAFGPALTAHELGLIERAGAFAREVIEPDATEWERRGEPLPAEAFRRYGREGFVGLQVPEQLGGAGSTFLCKIRIAELMARSCFAATFALNNTQSGPLRIVREGTADQAARHLPGLLAGERVCAPAITEPGAGSDATALATRARAVPGGWRVTGRKSWITNGASCDLLVAYVQTEPGGGAKTVASLLLDLQSEGVGRRTLHTPTGGAAIGAAAIAFEDVFVADRDLLAAPGRGFRAAMAGIVAARVHVAAMLNGAVARCLERAVEAAGRRVAFGRPVIDNQGLRWSLADVATRLEASRLLVDRAAARVEAGADAVLEAAQAKEFATTSALPAIAACMQATGARGLEADEPFGRALAAARIAAYVDGTTEMQRDRIGLALPGCYGPVTGTDRTGDR